MDSGLDASHRPGMTRAIGANFFSRIKVICPVQSVREKYSASAVGQISDLTPRVSPR
jgi:hypothetical protein